MDGKAAAVLFTALVLATPVAAEPPALPGSASRAPLGVIFDKALQRAMEKLDSPSCRLVLLDFRDASGRTIAEKLSDTGLPAPRYLTGLEFRDGRNEDLCHRGHIDAFTSVGGSTVWVCPGGSLWLGGDNNRAGANALIHEMLHTLGLEENPPSSHEITQRVRERCGL